MANLVKVKKSIKASDYVRISYINRNKSATYKEMIRQADNSWNYLEVNEGDIVEESVIDNYMAEILTRTWATFKGTTCMEDGRRLDIHSKRNR